LGLLGPSRPNHLRKKVTGGAYFSLGFPQALVIGKVGALKAPFFREGLISQA